MAIEEARRDIAGRGGATRMAGGLPRSRRAPAERQRRRRVEPAERLAHRLGWFSIALGLTEVLAPRPLARAIGIEGAPPEHVARVFGDDYATALQLFGVREIGSGLGILSRRRPSGWVWSRVLGDVLDLAFLASALQTPRTDRTRVTAAIAAVLGVTALDVLAGEQLSTPRAISRRFGPDGSIRVVHALAVNRPPEQCYRFWRDLENLPRIMRHLESVQVISDTRSHWRAKAPAGTDVEWDADIVEDVPGELITWHSVAGSLVGNDGSVRFQPGPKDRGTLVRVTMRYRPPAGRLGGVVAKLLGEEPEQQLREDLRRFKQVMETGEIITQRGQPSGPPRWSITRRITRT